MYCLVYPMLPLSLDCLFLIAPSVFSNVYLINIYINFANIKTKTCWRGLYLISCPVLTSFFSIFILLYFFNIYESYIFLHIHILHYNGKLLQIKTSNRVLVLISNFHICVNINNWCCIAWQIYWFIWQIRSTYQLEVYMYSLCIMEHVTPVSRKLD